MNNYPRHSEVVPNGKPTRSADHVTLVFGAMAASLRHQLTGRDTGRLVVSDAQADADAITRLYVRGLLTAAQRDVAYKKLMKEIAADMAIAA